MDAVKSLLVDLFLIVAGNRCLLKVDTGFVGNYLVCQLGSDHIHENALETLQNGCRVLDNELELGHPWPCHHFSRGYLHDLYAPQSIHKLGLSLYKEVMHCAGFVGFELCEVQGLLIAYALYG